MDIIRQLEAEQAAKIEAKRTLPEFQPGDTVRVQVRVTEGTRTRVQAYEGVVHRPRRRRLPGELHRPQDFLRRRRGARVPGLLADGRGRRDRPPRQGAPRQALLPARSSRQVGPHLREHRRSRPQAERCRARGAGRREGSASRPRRSPPPRRWPPKRPPRTPPRRRQLPRPQRQRKLLRPKPRRLPNKLGTIIRPRRLRPPFSFSEWEHGRSWRSQPPDGWSLGNQISLADELPKLARPIETDTVCQSPRRRTVVCTLRSRS